MRVRKTQEWSVGEVQVSYKPNPKPNYKIQTSDDVHIFLRRIWDDNLINLQEQFCAVFINNASMVIGYRFISCGTQEFVNVDLKLVFAIGIKLRAKGVIIAHNHPSGMLRPSEADITTTLDAKLIGELTGVKLFDHIILTNEGYLSLAETGHIDTNLRRSTRHKEAIDLINNLH